AQAVTKADTGYHGTSVPRSFMRSTRHATRALTAVMLMLSTSTWAQTWQSPTLIEPSEAVPTSTLPDTLSRTCFNSLALSPPATTACEKALAAATTPDLRAQIHSVLALQWARRGQAAAASQAIQAALDNNPQDALVQGNLGSVRLLSGDFNGAIAAYNSALQLPLDLAAEATVYLNRALALRGLGRYAEAREDFQLYQDLRGRGVPFDENYSSEQPLNP
ncbi:MAG: tetratricopeptide repeat protein, partial [Pseudomonadota bacterium]